MTLIFILSFLAVFAVVTPIAVIWSGAGSAGKKEQTLAALDTALSTQEVEKDAPILDFRRAERLSSIPWLNKMLLKLDIFERLRTMLNQAAMKWTPSGVFLTSVALFGFSLYLIDLRTGSFLFGVLVGLALGCLPILIVVFKRSQRFHKFEQGLPEALDLLVSALRVGHSLNSAMGLISRECPDPVGTEFRITYDEQNFGLELRAALEHLIARVPLQDVRIVVTALLIQRETGGNLAEVLEKVSYVIRQRFRLKKQVMVHTAQGRLTGWVLTILPIALGIALYILNPKQMSLLWTRDIGVKLMMGAGASLIIGSLIIQKIVRMEV